MSAGVLEEAEKHVKSAEKKLKKSLFGKWSISQNDYDIAALEFEKAAKLYQHLKKYDKSLEIWELCAENHGKALMPYSEGKAYESIATVYKVTPPSPFCLPYIVQYPIQQSIPFSFTIVLSCSLRPHRHTHPHTRQELKNEEQQVNYTKKAGIAFGEDGKPDKQAGAYVRAARLCRDNDVKTAAALVKEALEILNESENHYLMPEPGRLLVAINTKAGLYLEAVESVKYNLGHLEALEQKHNINKAAVEVVVLHLARNDTVMAERDYKELAGKYAHHHTHSATHACKPRRHHHHHPKVLTRLGRSVAVRRPHRRLPAAERGAASGGCRQTAHHIHPP